MEKSTTTDNTSTSSSSTTTGETAPGPGLFDSSELVCYDERPLDNVLDEPNEKSTQLTSTPLSQRRNVAHSSLITTLVSDSMMPDIPPTPEELRKFNIEKALINARIEVQELMEENQKLKSLIKDTKCQVVLRDDAIKKLETSIQDNTNLITELLEKQTNCSCHTSRKETYSEILRKGKKNDNHHKHVGQNAQKQKEKEDETTYPITTIVTQNWFSLLDEHNNPPQESDSSETKITFKGPDSILSNFSPCKLKYKGRQYNSAEQAFQTQHALFLKQHSVAQEITTAQHAGVAKRLAGKKLANTKEWNGTKGDVMREIIAEKAKQIPVFAKALKDTGSHPLSHNVPDEYWGTGRTGMGQNMMGKILEEIREDPQLVAGNRTETQRVDPTKTKDKRDATSILLIGNSNVKGLAQILNPQVCTNTQLKSFALSGADAGQIKTRLPFLNKGPAPSHVILHALDNNIHNGQHLQDSIKEYE